MADDRKRRVALVTGAGDPHGMGAAIDTFFANGIAAGGSDEGAPGPREAIPNSYAAYLRDPTGNKLVAWCVKEA